MAPLKQTLRIFAWDRKNPAKSLTAIDDVVDVGVEARRARARREHVPERDAPFAKCRDAALVRSRCIDLEQRGHDLPERVARMCVVLARPQRCLARHRTEDQHLARRVGDRREAVNAHASQCSSTSPSISTGISKGSSARPTALRQCAPVSGPKSSRIRSEKPLITLGCRLNPGAEFTMPKTRTHAAIRSRSPSARSRLPRIDSAVRRAAA